MKLPKADDDEQPQNLTFKSGSGPTFWQDWIRRGPLDRINSIIGVLALIIGVPALIELYRKDLASTTALAFFICESAFLHLVFIFLYFREKVLRTDIGRRHERDAKYFAAIFKTITSKFHNINHEKRDLMNRSQFQPRVLPLEQTSQFLLRICDEIKELFDAIFSQEGYRFHVSIKGIITNDEKPVVATLARDREMVVQHSFKVHDAEHPPVFGNMAFEKLLDADKTDFCDDDLPTHPDYCNTSVGWQSRYNATMVVPIRRNHIEKNNVFELVGYLGIDCLRQRSQIPVFCISRSKPRDEIKDILLGYADSVYGILKRGHIYDGPKKAPQGKYRIDTENLDFIVSLHRQYLGRDSTSSAFGYDNFK